MDFRPCQTTSIRSRDTGPVFWHGGSGDSFVFDIKTSERTFYRAETEEDMCAPSTSCCFSQSDRAHGVKEQLVHPAAGGSLAHPHEAHRSTEKLRYPCYQEHPGVYLEQTRDDQRCCVMLLIKMLTFIFNKIIIVCRYLFDSILFTF